MDYGQISHQHKQKFNESEMWLCGVFSKILTSLTNCGNKRNKEERCILKLTNKIEYLQNRLECLNRTVEDISNKTDGTPVGFSASLLYPVQVTPESILNCFRLVKCNAGGCFDPNTGVFTAPEGGLYFTSIALDIEGGDRVDALVVRERGGARDVVAKINAASLGTCACSTAVVELLRGDTLFAKCIGSSAVSKTLSCYSNYVCFKIS